MRTGSPFKQASRLVFTQSSWGSGAGFAPGLNAAQFTPANIGSATGGVLPAQGMSAAGTGGFLAFALMMGLSHMAKARETMRKIQAAKRREYAARGEMNRYKNIYENLQVTNPYSNLKNPFENMGLSIDRRKALFERDQFQQQQANMLTSLQQGASGSGMANRVKLLSQMGIEAGQKSAESIGLQEEQMRLIQPKMYAQIDQLERSGRNISAIFEKDKYAKLLGMAQSEMFGYMDEQYKQQNRGAEAGRMAMDNFTSLAGGTSSRWQDPPYIPQPPVPTDYTEGSL